MILLDFSPTEQRPQPALPAVSQPAADGEGQQTTLVAELSHELRGPLGAIHNAVQLLHECGADPAMREYVEGVLERQTRHMTHLVEDLLVLSRIGRGKVQLQKEPTELAQILNEAIETVRPCLEEHGHQLEVVLPPEPIALEADPDRLEQVLVNLLTNAVKYTDPGGRIGLIAAREGERLVLRVRDTGIGIAPEMLPHVFDLFWQSPRAAEHARGGLGIGLALVRQLVELHGGSVSALSLGLGQGSEFVVYLPLGQR